MSLLYIIELSIANLMSRKIRSILTVSGVIIGISAITFLLSIGYGFEKMTTQQIAAPNAMSIFEASLEESDIVSMTDENIAAFKNLNDVSQVEAGVILAGKAKVDEIKTDVVVDGYSNGYMDFASIRLLRGERFKDDDADKVIVSTALLNLLNIPLEKYNNKDISADIVLNQSLAPNATEGENKTIGGLKIVGVVDDDDSPFMIVPLNLIRQDTGIINYNTARIKVADSNKLPDVRRQVEGMGFGTNFIGDTIKQINAFFMIFRYIIGGFGFIAMLVAILGMLNTLTVSLLERTREIGVLKSNGATRKDIWRLFISEALLISMIGGFCGIILGVVTGEIVNLIFNIYAKSHGAQPIDFFYTPLSYVLYSLIFVMLVGFLTGFYPAKRATKIKVLDALKYE